MDPALQSAPEAETSGIFSQISNFSSKPRDITHDGGVFSSKNDNTGPEPGILTYLDGGKDHKEHSSE
jgi:hypothetical protein